jgi:hypothetical protein
MPTHIGTDYLVVGAGAMGMAFADTLIAETGASVTLVDRYHQPGGHWLMAYPFVRLHQPSVGYGVNSRPLGSAAIDRHGWNKGLYELAGVGEICAYFDHVLHQTLLPSGRVQYYPMCEYTGNQRFRAIVSGEEFAVDVRRKVVDSTYQHVTVPAMRPPQFGIAPGMHVVPPNALADLRAPAGHYTVIGAGKTGIDTCLWLLRQGADPDRITWIMPRDAWLVDRAACQPGPLFAEAVTPGLVGQFQAILAANSIGDLFVGLENAGILLRLDNTVQPEMFRCATVSKLELAQLRRIRHVVRLGRVQRIEQDRIVLDHGSLPTEPATLLIDCTADGLERRPVAPVFDGKLITLQTVRSCQQVFSAAFIAHVEAAYDDDAAKNDICVPVPHPNATIDWLHGTIANMRNDLRWARDAGLAAWLQQSRLNWPGRLGPPLPDEASARATFLVQKHAALDAMATKLAALVADAKATVLV